MDYGKRGYSKQYGVETIIELEIGMEMCPIDPNLKPIYERLYTKELPSI